MSLTVFCSIEGHGLPQITKKLFGATLTTGLYMSKFYDFGKALSCFIQVGFYFILLFKYTSFVPLVSLVLGARDGNKNAIIS